MNDDTTDATRTGVPTRRDAIASGGAVVGGLLAGCIGADGSGDGDSEAAPTETGTDGGSEVAEDGGYSVSISPVGEVSFEEPPERVYTGLPNTADMAIAAGQAEGITSVYFPEYHGTLLNNFYERLDGVSFEWDGLTDSWKLDKEGFYELDSDVHLTDPAYASTLETIDADDVAEIGEEIAPWIGNYYSNTHSTPPTKWADDYQYYGLWEIFETVASVFRSTERYRALHEEYRNLRSTIEAGLPPSDERPTVALTFPTEDSIGIFHLNAPGFLAAHTRPLGAVDAFADAEFEQTAQIDMEAMAEADPDVILALFRLASGYSIEATRDRFETDPVGRTISAVEAGRIFSQGIRYQGPITTLFQLEMTAKQLYPDRFGEWPGYVDGEPYPELPEAERLFDRQRVADIVTGEI
ncbi:ABC transporter substrate-binding protein [Halovivax limisalsi]|uniref:ABC transporter substrate-binding protein n=1 Tax=Halovivax limisalsi TaxID=1453760 RepID=UPI001FFD490F|nr:ABC transporter substrate-binding protein [Halovivax limisalsi]